MTVEEILSFITKVGGAIGAVILAVINFKKIIALINKFIRLPDALLRIENSLTLTDGTSIQEALRRIEERQIMQEYRMRFVLDSNLEMGIYETDKYGNCLKVSNVYCKMLNKTEDECTGSKWVSSIHNDDKDRVLSEWNEAIKYGRVFDSTFRFLRQNDSPFKVKSRANPVFDKKGDIIAWIGAITLIYN